VTVRTILILVIAVAAAVGCSSESEGQGRPDIAVTTNVLGDVVENLVGSDAAVHVLMPPGASPHDFAPAPKQVATMRDTDVLVVNGRGFEERLGDAIDAAAAAGVTVVTGTDSVEGDDPHFFTDPVRMAEVVHYLEDQLSEAIPELDTAAFHERARSYIADLDQLDATIEDTLAVVPPGQRVLVTNHDVFGYFAERYGFNVLGTVIPSRTTLAAPAAADLAQLVEDIEANDVPAIFADTSSPAELAEALAEEGLDIQVVELYSESLGEPGSPGDTYLGMMRTDAQRIADALTK
jgi:zinc/manganese transport system substrate-binding protein